MQNGYTCLRSNFSTNFKISRETHISPVFGFVFHRYYFQYKFCNQVQCRCRNETRIVKEMRCVSIILLQAFASKLILLYLFLWALDMDGHRMSVHRSRFGCQFFSFVQRIWVQFYFSRLTILVTEKHVPISGGSIRRYDSTKILVQTQAFTWCSRSSVFTFLLSYLTVVAVATFIFIKNSFSWAWAWRKCIWKATWEQNTQRKQQTQRENMRQRCSQLMDV